MSTDHFSVGFVGYKNSGKTHISTRLQEISPLINPIGFSDPLYRALHEATGIPIEDFQKKELRELPNPLLGGKSIQFALNSLGTEWGRKMIHEDIWLDRAFSKRIQGKINLFDNVRFLNEWDMVIYGDHATFAIYNSDVAFDGTTPESHIDGLQHECDFRIYNDGQEFAKNPEEIEILRNLLHLLMTGLPIEDCESLLKQSGHIVRTR